MPSSTRSLVLRLVFAAILTAATEARAAPSVQPDAKGGQDSPLIRRFDGSWLTGYKTSAWDQAAFPTSAQVADSKWAAPLVVEGRLTRVFYIAPLGKTPLEVFRNYQQALVNAGFKQLGVCERSCGDLYWAFRKTVELAQGMQFASGSLSEIGGGNYSLTGGLVTPSNGRFSYGTLARDGQDVRVLLYVSDAENDRSNIASTYLQIVEPKPMQTGQVKVDANGLEKGLQADGKIALYGLYFDTGKSDIKPESKPQLEEMAKLMQAQPQLRVYIVGHTDDQGSLEGNRGLSQQRAQAVVAALARDYGVDAKRMVAAGVASLAPLATNDSEAGRAKNRRVELVKQ